jgi:hypothetical protein
MAVYLIGMHLRDIYFMGMHLMGVYLMGAYLMGMRLIGMHLKGVQSQEPVHNDTLDAVFGAKSSAKSVAIPGVR